MAIIERIGRPHAVWLIALATGSMLVATISFGASVRQVGLAEMLSSSELVFHGTALESWTTQGEKIDDIFTHIRFQIHEVVKGNYFEDTIELVFLGGTYGRYRLDISDQVMPDTGEEGVYFVEQLTRTQVNPFYGWHQGRFVVAEELGDTDKRIRTSGNEPVYQLTPTQTLLTTTLSDGPARGVRTQRLGQETGLSLDSFKRQLRQFAGLGQ